jgi:TIR domain
MKMSQQFNDASGKNSKIFISYRREDSRGHAILLHRDLQRHFGDERVFMDTSGIGGGEDFVRVIEERLASGEVLIAVIGREWLKLLNDTKRSHEKDADWVHLEIATALEKRIPVIPVLVDGAGMPETQDLPEAIQQMTRRQAVMMRDDQWELDLARLIRILEQAVPKEKKIMLTSIVTLALLGMLFLVYRFVTVPLPMRLDADSQINFPPAMLGTDEIIIEGPVVNTSTGLLLSGKVERDEEISLEMEKAQLSQTTIDDFELDPPSASIGRIIYSYSPEEKSASNRPCTTSVEIKLKDAKLPDAIHFQNTVGPEGGKDYRALDIKSVGADSIINIIMTPKDSASAPTSDQPGLPSMDDGPGCWKHLITPSGVDRVFYGGKAVESIVTPDSMFHFRFTPTNDEKPLWDAEEGLLEPFVFGSPPQADSEEKLSVLHRWLFSPKPFATVAGLQARAVIIKRLMRDDILVIRSVDEKSTLRIDSLKVGSKQLQVSVFGEGFVRLNGKDAVGLRERIERYPVKAALLAIATIVLAVWLALLVRRLLHNQR